MRLNLNLQKTRYPVIAGGGGGGASIYTDFSQYALGSNLIDSPDWEVFDGSATDIGDIREDSFVTYASPGGAVVNSVINANWSCSNWIPMGNPKNFSLTVSGSSTSGSREMRVGARHQGTGSYGDCYMPTFDPFDKVISLLRISGTSIDTLGEVSVVDALMGSGRLTHCKMEFIDDAIKIKMWDAESAEPGWQIEVSDTTHSTGGGLGIFNISSDNTYLSHLEGFNLD